MTNALRSGSACLLACLFASSLAVMTVGCATGASVGVGEEGGAGPVLDASGLLDASRPKDGGGIVFVDSSRPGTDSGGCGAGFALCAGSCVNTSMNVLNCGVCTNACASGMSCTGGVCGAATGSCTGSEIFCGSACIDPTSDVSNCGGCGTACPSGDTCVTSICTAPGGCPSGATMCGTECTQTSSDPDNCGTCSMVCSSGTCTGGECAEGEPDAGGGGGGGCAHSPCSTGGPLTQDCDDDGDGIVSQVCEDLSECCTTSWDNDCVEDADSYEEEYCYEGPFDLCFDPGC